MYPMVALMGAQMAMSILNGRNQARASAAQAKANRIASIDAMVDETNQLNEQSRQQDEIGHSQKVAARLRALHAESTGRASGRTIQGNSVDRMEQEVMNMLGREITNANLNQEGRRRALKMKKKGAYNKSLSRINSTPAIGYNPTNDIIQGGISMYSANQAGELHDKQMAGG